MGVPLLPGEMWHSWWIDSATSREHAEQLALGFREGDITFIGENDLYYSFRLVQSWVYACGTPGGEWVYRVIVYKEEAFFRTFCNENGRSDIVYEIRDLSRESVLHLLNIEAFFGSDRLMGSQTIYRELQETDTHFVYTWYTITGSTAGNLQWISCGSDLLKNQMMIDKSTGRFVEHEFSHFGGGTVFILRHTSETLLSVRMMKTVERPSDELPPLTDDVLQKIQADWSAWAGSLDFDFGVAGHSYFGTHNGNVVYLHSPGFVHCATWSEQVGDYVFSYAHGYRVWVWNSTTGEFLPLGDHNAWCEDTEQVVLAPGAYGSDWVSSQDVHNILARFQQYYPRKFGCQNHGRVDCPECAYWVN
jgi:hypothetical protein